MAHEHAKQASTKVSVDMNIIRGEEINAATLPLWTKSTGMNPPDFRLPVRQQPVDHLRAEPAASGFPVSSTRPCSSRKTIRPILELCSHVVHLVAGTHMEGQKERRLVIHLKLPEIMSGH